MLHTEKTKSNGKVHFGVYSFDYQFFHGYLEGFSSFIGNETFECGGQSKFCLENKETISPCSPQKVFDLEAILCDKDKMR